MTTARRPSSPRPSRCPLRNERRTPPRSPASPPPIGGSGGCVVVVHGLLVVVGGFVVLVVVPGFVVLVVVPGFVVLVVELPPRFPDGVRPDPVPCWSTTVTRRLTSSASTSRRLPLYVTQFLSVGDDGGSAPSTKWWSYTHWPPWGSSFSVPPCFSAEPLQVALVEGRAFVDLQLAPVVAGRRRARRRRRARAIEQRAHLPRQHRESTPPDSSALTSASSTRSSRPSTTSPGCN